MFMLGCSGSCRNPLLASTPCVECSSSSSPPPLSKFGKSLLQLEMSKGINASKLSDHKASRKRQYPNKIQLEPKALKMSRICQKLRSWCQSVWHKSSIILSSRARQAPGMGNLDCECFLMLSLDPTSCMWSRARDFHSFIDHGNTLWQENAPNNPSFEFTFVWRQSSRGFFHSFSLFLGEPR